MHLREACLGMGVAVDVVKKDEDQLEQDWSMQRWSKRLASFTFAIEKIIKRGGVWQSKTNSQQSAIST